MKGAVSYFGMFGTLPRLKWAEDPGQSLVVGDPVLVRKRLSPLTGQFGKVTDIAPGDPYGPYLVQFDSGLQYRYHRSELAPTSNSDSAIKDR
jgi:hypothetical protein